MKSIFEKLNSKNYDAWSYKMKMILIKDDLWEYVNGDCPAQEIVRISATDSVPASETVTNQREISDWKKKDEKALAVIVLCMEDSKLSLIKKMDSSKKAWNLLKEHYVKSTISNKASVLKRVCQMRLEEGGDVESHLLKMEELFEKLAGMGRELEEDLRVVLILQSLPDSFNTLVTALEARDEKDLTMDLVTTKILDHHRNKEKDGTSDKALKVFQRKDMFTCNYCKEEGHIKKNCSKLKAKMEKEKNPDSRDVHRANFCFGTRISGKQQDSQVQEKQMFAL